MKTGARNILEGIKAAEGFIRLVASPEGQALPGKYGFKAANQ